MFLADGPKVIWYRIVAFLEATKVCVRPGQNKQVYSLVWSCRAVIGHLFCQRITEINCTHLFNPAKVQRVHNPYKIGFGALEYL